MKLKKLELENFKGVKTFVLDLADGKNAAVFGDNHTGKTTLMDAYFWLLLGKNAEGRADFAVKTEGTKALDYGVTGTFLHEGRTVVLRRVLRENWVRKNGAEQSEFRGNKTEYWVDDVPKGEREYKEFLREWFGMDEKMLHLLSDPRVFSERLKDNERRDLLLETFAEDLSDHAILYQNPDLSPLLEQLQYKSVDNYMEQLKSQRKKLNDQLAELPGRIDEANRAKPSDTFTEQDRARLAELLKEKIQLEQGLQDGLAGQTAVLREQLAEVKNELAQEKIAYTEKFLRGNETVEKQAAQVRGELRDLQREQECLERGISNRERSIQEYERDLTELRRKWEEVNSRNPEGGSLCPACGQELPPEQREEAREKFNLRKAEQQEKIAQDAEGIKEKQAESSAALEAGKKQLPEVLEGIKALEARLQTLQNAIVSPPPFEESREAARLLAQRSKLEGELAAVSEQAQEQTAGQRKRLTEIGAETERLKAREAAQKQAAEQDRRIAELMAQEKELGIQLAEVDRLLHLCGQFITTKAGMVEEQINAAFRAVRWKLFDLQVNGGIKPCCRATVHGVDYANLSNSEKLNAGLDILEGLAQKQGSFLPVWVDNAESATQLFPVSAQCISLRVSEPDKKIRVEWLQ